MSRVQLALNVDDMDAAAAFYSRLFDAEPDKRLLTQTREAWRRG